VSIFTRAGTSRGSSKDDRRRHMIYRRTATVAMIAGVLLFTAVPSLRAKGRASPEGLLHRAPACKGPFANRWELCCRHRSAGQRAGQSVSSARWPNPDITNHSNDAPRPACRAKQNPRTRCSFRRQVHQLPMQYPRAPRSLHTRRRTVPLLGEPASWPNAKSLVIDAGVLRAPASM
jgi:hypothetical protein